MVPRHHFPCVARILTRSSMSTTPSTGSVHEILCQIPTLTAPYRAVLEYRSPIKSGEPLTIRYEQHDDVVRMHFVVGDDVRAAALLRRL